MIRRTLLLLQTLVLVACSSQALRDLSGRHDGGETHNTSVPEDTGKPTDEAEGLPGYLTDPRVVSILKDTDGALVATAPSGAVATDGDLNSVFVNMWSIDPADLDKAQAAPGEPLAIPAKLMAAEHAASDGAFAVSAPEDPGHLVILTIGQKTSASTLGDALIQPIEGKISAVIKDLATDGPPRPLLPPDLKAHGAAVAALASATAGIWLSREEVLALPTEGPAWQFVVDTAAKAVPLVTVVDPDNTANALILARALVFARTGDANMRNDVIAACNAVIGTEAATETSTLGHKLAAYIIAADLVGLPKENDSQFRDWLKKLLTIDLGGRTLISAQEDRPNNWGVHAGSARIAIAAYLATRPN